MKIFNLIYFEDLALVFNLIAILVGFFAKSRKKAKSIFYANLFLIVTLSVEILGLIFTSVLHKASYNRILYNNYLTLEFCFYFYLLRFFVRDKAVKKLIYWAIGAYAILGFINSNLLQGKHGSFSSITYSVGCFIIIGLLLYYFYELMLYPSDIKLTKQPAFWICSGLLFFYTSTFTVFGLTNFTRQLSETVLNGISVFLTITNIVLYSMFSIAFLCQTQTTKSSSSLSLEAS